MPSYPLGIGHNRIHTDVHILHGDAGVLADLVLHLAHDRAADGGDIDAVAAVAGKAAVKKKMEEIKNKGNDKTAKEEGTYVVLQIVIEMLARGIEFLPVDIYKSDWRVYKIEDGKIRLPFSAIAGVGETAAKAISDAVHDGGGEFISCDDLMARAHIGASVVDSLRECGALGDLPDSNQISLFGF